MNFVEKSDESSRNSTKFPTKFPTKVAQVVIVGIAVIWAGWEVSMYVACAVVFLGLSRKVVERGQRW